MFGTTPFVFTLSPQATALHRLRDGAVPGCAHAIR